MTRATRSPGGSALIAFAVALLAGSCQDVPPAGGLKQPTAADIDWNARSQQPLPPASEVEARYARTWELVKAEDYDAALDELIWLWSATDNKASAFEPEIRDRIIESIGRIAAYDEPTRLRFTTVLDDLDAFLREDPPQSFREWTDWADLSRAMKQEDRLIRLYEERRAPDGSLEAFAELTREELLSVIAGKTPTRGGAVFHPYAYDDLFEVLLERARFADAGRLYKDLEGEARMKLEITDASLEEVAGHLSAEEIEADRQQAREHAALLCALGLAAERQLDSEKVAAALLERYDDVASRRALVLACRRVGVSSPLSPNWISEARERGADVSDLEVPEVDPASPK